MSTKKKKAKKESESPERDDENDGTWQCSVCTYLNRYEAFKCEMCDTRKGTSTRKPRLNENVVETQKVVQNFIIQQQLPKTPKRKSSEALLFETPSTSKVLNSPETSKPPLDGSSLIGVSDEFSNAPRRRNVPLPEALIEREHYMQREVVVNNVKAMIKEYRPKAAARARVSALLNNALT